MKSNGAASLKLSKPPLGPHTGASCDVRRQSNLRNLLPVQVEWRISLRCNPCKWRFGGSKVRCERSEVPTSRSPSRRDRAANCRLIRSPRRLFISRFYSTSARKVSPKILHLPQNCTTCPGNFGSNFERSCRYVNFISHTSFS